MEIDDEELLMGDLLVLKLGTIPSIILENLSKENENFELENQKQFFSYFGEVLNIIITNDK